METKTGNYEENHSDKLNHIDATVNVVKTRKMDTDFITYIFNNDNPIKYSDLGDDYSKFELSFI
jgi:hypothetical protein